MTPRDGGIRKLGPHVVLPFINTDPARVPQGLEAIANLAGHLERTL